MRQKQSRLSAFIGLVILLIIIFLFGLALFKAIKWQRALLENKKSLSDKLNALKAESEQLKQQLTLNSQEAIIEEELRLNIGMSKPGEKVVILVPPKKIEANSNNEKQGLFASFLTQIKNLWQNLFGKK